MAKGRCRVAAVAGLAGLLLGPGLAWAQRPEGRAARRQQAEQRIDKLDERLQDVEVEGDLAQAWLDLARRHRTLASKLLDRNNERAADVIARKAERYLDLAEGREPDRQAKEEAQP